MINIDWKNISYLQCGNNKQKKCHEILEKISIFKLLSEHKPVLVGTIPIEIDIESSDLDIVCKVINFKKFQELLTSKFGEYEDFNIIYDEEKLVVVCNFRVDNMEIEIYGSREDTDKLNGYRHMVIEHRILKLGGEKLKNSIIKLKEDGLKTEPAFASILQLKGNPYEGLLLLEKCSDEELKEKIFKHNLTETVF